MALFGWKVVYGGKTPPPGKAVAPLERLSWGRTVGLGAQHVVAMFGATFVFPVVMGLDPNLAILFSGVATILFLLVVRNRVPSYLGTSGSFVAGVAAIRAQGGDSAAVTGAILISGVVLAIIGVLVHFLGANALKKVLPPAVTGAVVMLIGFNLAPVVANTYWPQDQWVALLTAAFVVIAAVRFPGFLGRISVFLGLVFGYIISWLADLMFGPITSFSAAAGKVTTHHRVDLTGVGEAKWFGLPSHHLTDGVSAVHGPSISLAFVLLILPSVIALIAENTGHVRAVAEMTKTDLDPYMGRALAADGVATTIASAFGASPTTTYAENIGVMSATRVYSTAAYYVAAAVAILLGLCPKFGVVVDALPGGVLGGITVVLYGMIGLIGAKIWVDSRVNFADPLNVVPLAAGLIAAIGNVTLQITKNFELGGIALGTIIVVVFYHVVNIKRPPYQEQTPEGTPAPTAAGGAPNAATTSSGEAERDGG